MSSQEALQSFLGGRVRVFLGDITLHDVDAVVNAANSSLLGGGGVDGAIHFRGGPQIIEECRELRRTRYPQGLPTGEAVLTGGGRLAARHVIHTVGPIVRLGQEPDAAKLAACYRNSLTLAVEHSLRSIAFPAISTGAFGYPAELAAPVVSRTLESSLMEESSLEEVRLVFYAPRDAKIFLWHQTFATTA
jgi:O-acetyl-ADP-ribose deacetylase (regulator of RNase III)